MKLVLGALPAMLFLSACATGTGAARDGPAAATVGFDRIARVGGFAITPKVLLEDSRCARGVQCVQAGTVRIEALIETSEAAALRPLELGESVDFAGESVTLARVCPYPVHGIPIAADAYRFTFAVGADSLELADC